MHDEFMAFLLDEESFRAARAVAEARGYPSAVVQEGGLDVLAGMLEQMAPPKMLLLDLDREPEPLDAGRRALGLCGPGCRILFTASRNDVSLYRKLRQLGAADYLVKPLTADMLGDAVMQAMRPPAAPGSARDDGRKAHIVTVTGARGGAGASTVAVNLAWTCAHALQKRVLLFDLDTHFGIASLSLDREPGKGLRAALENPERVDNLLVASSMVQESDQLAVLSTEEPLDKPLNFDGEALMALLAPVREDFDLVICDLPRAILPAQKRLIGAAHMVIVACDLTLASLRDARRLRTWLKTLRPDLLPLMVANRTGESASATIDRAAFEKNLEAKFDFFLPEDVKTARAAANGGKAFTAIAPQAEVSRQLTALARLVAGAPEERDEPENRGLIGKLMDFLDGAPKPAPKPAKD